METNLSTRLLKSTHLSTFEIKPFSGSDIYYGYWLSPKEIVLKTNDGKIAINLKVPFSKTIDGRFQDVLWLELLNKIEEYLDELIEFHKLSSPR